MTTLSRAKSDAEAIARRDELKRHRLQSYEEGAWFTCGICQKYFRRGYL